jgi:ligand-binding sensor domain-containing protein/signal transduction histidine kinase
MHNQIFQRAATPQVLYSYSIPIKLRYWRSALFIAAVLFYSYTSFGQPNLKFTHLTILDGLSQSTVQAIVKDQHGFMWFGTQDGLNRYDGYNFKIYRHKPKDPTSLRKSYIRTLYVDRQKNLWVGTANGGLSLYDQQHDAFIHYKESSGNFNGLSQKSVSAIYEDRQNNFWVGTYWKLNLLDRKTGKITQFANNPDDTNSLSNDGITCISEDSKGNLWIGTSNGLNILDRRTKKCKRFFHTNDPSSISDNEIKVIYEDNLGRLWIGTGNGLNRYDHASGKFSRFNNNPADATSIGHNQVSAIEDAGNGKLWIGTRESLDHYDPDKNVFSHYRSNAKIPTTLSKNGCITSLLYDNGILWAGTFQAGINKYDESLTYFDTYRNNPYDSLTLSFNIVTSMAENPDGDIWIATGGGALNLWKRNSGRFIRFAPNPTNKNSLSNWGLLCLYQGKKNKYLWIGSYGSCIDRYDPVTGIFRHYTKGDGPGQLNNDAVYAILEDSRGNIWMGTNGGGVNVLDQGTGIITKYIYDPDNNNSIGGDYVRSFFEDRKGNIWVGSTGGISVFDTTTRSFSNYNSNNLDMESDVINSIFQDSKGNMWIGTASGGLSQLDPATKKLVTYTTYDGLPDNTINSIIEDQKGYLWISTNNGISRFDPVKKVFKNSNLDNGIQSNEFSQGAGIRTSKGEILFGGVNGFNVVDPNNLVENKKIPPVVITDFKLFNKPVTVGEKNSPLKENISMTKDITLSYDQSIITFEFAALGFTTPYKNEYAYMLEGFDRDWNYSGSNNKATYTNLNPGSYTFKVKGSNNDGKWNELGTSLQLTITPPFWQTWWFKSLAVILLLAVVLSIFRYRVRAIHAQKLLLEKQVLERTQSLANMTLEERKARQEADDAVRELERKNRELEQFAYVASHDLQEPLRTTSTSAELFHKQYIGKLDDRADKYLGFIMQSTDRMRVLITDLLEYSRIGKKKELKEIDCNLLLEEVLADLGTAIDETFARIKIEKLPVINGYSTELKLLFQNLITNAVKFRKKDIDPEITITAEKTGEDWKFSVVDNGIGMDQQHSEKIFIIFQRLHTRSEYPGSGIGLSHCKKIAELHKGKIWVESQPGEGSKFYFTIRDRLIMN